MAVRKTEDSKAAEAQAEAEKTGVQLNGAENNVVEEKPVDPKNAPAEEKVAIAKAEAEQAEKASETQAPAITVQAVQPPVVTAGEPIDVLNAEQGEIVGETRPEVKLVKEGVGTGIRQIQQIDTTGL